MYYVDLNSDLGESFGNYTIGMDEEILKYVSSANVACGWHAGDPMVMEKTVALAKEFGTAVGAHPGFPDLMGFGRRNMVVTPEEAKAYLKYLYSDEAQELIAENYYRPVDQTILKKHVDTFNLKVKLTTIKDFGGWDAVQKKHFADGGVFDEIYEE